MKTLHTRKMTRKTLTAAIAAVTLACAPVFAGDAQHADAMNANDDTGITQQVKDAWLEGRVESALLFNEHLDSFAIDTRVHEGKAVLSGSVESEIDRDLAGEITQLVDGVDSVDNRLTVDATAGESAKDSEAHRSDSEWRQSVMDATTTAEIKTRLLLNDHTGGLAINVDTADGVVTLSGEVDSEEEIDLAGKIAANIAGEQNVDNRLSVSDKVAAN